MNPMVVNLMIWEKELELERQAGRRPGYDPDRFYPGYPRPQRQGRKPRFAWVLRIFKAQPWPICECLPETSG